MQPNEAMMAKLKPGCICKGVKLNRLIEVIDRGAASFEEVAAILGIGDGPCQGKRCGEKIAQLLSDRDINT